MSKKPIGVLVQQAETATRQGDHSKATKLLQRAIKDQPSSVDLATRLSQSLISGTRAKEAVRLLKKMLSIIGRSRAAEQSGCCRTSLPESGSGSGSGSSVD